MKYKKSPLSHFKNVWKAGSVKLNKMLQLTLMNCSIYWGSKTPENKKALMKNKWMTFSIAKVYFLT